MHQSKILDTVGGSTFCNWRLVTIRKFDCAVELVAVVGFDLEVGVSHRHRPFPEVTHDPPVDSICAGGPPSSNADASGTENRVVNPA